MKRKILALCLVVALAGIGIVGATLAYFTDSDGAINTFTLGSVEIKLYETNDPEQTEMTPKEYQDWLDGQDGDLYVNTLIPAVIVNDGTEIRNQVPKIVTVENTGNNEAIIWLEVYIPTALDYPEGLQTPAHALDPVNQYSVRAANSSGTASLHMIFADDVVATLSLYNQVDPDGNYPNYNVYLVAYSTNNGRDNYIAPGDFTGVLLQSIYMDPAVQQVEDELGNVIDGTLLLVDGETIYEHDWVVGVNAVAIQAQGFDVDNPDFFEAVEAYYN